MDIPFVQSQEFKITNQGLFKKLHNNSRGTLYNTSWMPNCKREAKRIHVLFSYDSSRTTPSYVVY